MAGTPENIELVDAVAERSGREMLLEAAGELMSEIGSIDVSLHQIAKRAGVTAPLVKYHFGSKDGLLLALAQRDTAQSIKQLTELMAMNLDPATKLRVHIQGIIRTYSRFPYLNRLLEHFLDDPEAEGTRQIWSSFLLPLIEAQKQIITAGIAAGQFREVDYKYVYFLINGACQYIFSTRITLREMIGEKKVGQELAREYAAFAAETVLRGMAK
ncbi:TetR family transcriptional regulator [Hyphomonas polymorpha PS728]|uniref:TetR family transcriptional regulator n=1 Tax=Hyphomonas polymorpha PS728 TaxID=1280954 RepID=A0A062VA15_9PROT|nr:TetR family transcriptional regulator [Hyphomonas polymorpha]KCZ96994.1 TetR family transcriptional regulator [Hyphomonas polymorpha PS728]